MSGNRDVLAVILARAGSKGLPGKNALELAGRPMVHYAIDHARDALTVTETVVSTDGPAIAEAARLRKTRVIERPPELATDTATVAAAARHAVIAAGGDHPVIVILYANVPVRPAGLIDCAVRMLDDTGCDSVQSYTAVGRHHPFWMVRLESGGRVQPFVASDVDRRQDLPALYLPDGGVIAVRRRSLLEWGEKHPHAFLGIDRRAVINGPGEVVDVDSAEDLALAEACLSGLAFDAAGPGP